MAGGLREYSECGSEDYAFQAGVAARNGITAARLAAAGATSGPSALDGKAGFFRAFGEPGRDYAARVTERLGDEFEMLAVTYKPYPICQFHRGIVRGFAALRDQARGKPLADAHRPHASVRGRFLRRAVRGAVRDLPADLHERAVLRGARVGTRRRDARGPHRLRRRRRARARAAHRHRVRPGAARYSPRIEVRLADGTVLEWEERDAADAYLLTFDAARTMAARLAREAGVEAGALVASVEALPAATGVAAVVAAMREACRAARIAA